MNPQLSTLNSQQSEELRHAVLEALAIRHPAAFNPAQIRQRVQKELDFKIEPEALASALQFLKDAQFLTVEPDTLGSTQYWSANSKGVLEYERRLK